jgi:hypothetical protein
VTALFSGGSDDSHERGEDEEVEHKVRAGGRVETAHKIENDGEEKDVARVEGHVGCDSCDGECGGTVEPVADLTVEDGATHHLTGQLGERRESLQAQ